MIINKNYRENFAYDLSKNIVSKGEVIDKDCINQSIELILSTSYGERVMNPYFGCELTNTLFEAVNEQSGEKLLSNCIDSIKTWEDRVEIIESECRLKIFPDSHTLQLIIPYIIKKNNITNTFAKKIIL